MLWWRCHRTRQEPVPVTAKLSREFYEKFGDKIADELVNWFNQMDTSYRAEFKDLFEVHFSRFEAKLEQRAGELRAEIGATQTRFDARLDQRLAESGARWEKRLAESDARWERRLAELDAKWERRLAELDAKWEHQIGELKTSLILWMFGFWTATTFIMLGTTIAILKL
jgi:hypothetical protein